MGFIKAVLFLIVLTVCLVFVDSIQTSHEDKNNVTMSLTYSETQGFYEIRRCTDEFVCDERFLFCLDYIGDVPDSQRDIKPEEEDTKLLYCKLKEL